VSGLPEFFGFSGQILSVRGAWGFLTAGHVIDGIEARLESRRYKMQFFLADNFGPNVVCHQAIPFDYESAVRPSIDRDGIDFGLVSIRPLYRALLEKNGVVSITEENWIHQDKVACDRYMMLGFPSTLNQVDIQQTSAGYVMTAAVSPTMAWVTKLERPPDDFEETPFPQFVGQLLSGGLDDIDGMSGCPIFGVQKVRNDLYWIVAIQNSWLPKRRIIFGTPLPVLGHYIEVALEASAS
jgi:hypothetical protein